VTRHSWFAAACAAAALTLACESPAGPGPLERPIGGRGQDNSTLKSSAPRAVSPRDNEVVGSLTPALVVNNSRAIPAFVPMLVFEVFDDRNALVYRSGSIAQHPSNTTSHVVEVPLAPGGAFSWQAIPVLEGRVGPASARATFRTP
jgi:hypothetical protein